MSPDWVIGVLSVLLLVHVLGVTYALIQRGLLKFDGEYRVRAHDYESAISENSVRCPHCNTENGTEYRYCRGCVSELPTRMALESGSSGAQGRRTI